jgi:hypothetical protein
MSKPITSFGEFWPFYLNEHRKPLTRAIHLAGTAGGLLVLGAAVATGNWWLPLAGLAAGYGSAWSAHAFIEKNKPATFTYPLWSLVSDFKMLGHFVTGTLSKDVERHLGPAAASRPSASAAPAKAVFQRVRTLAQQFRAALAPKLSSSVPPTANPSGPKP